MDYKSQSNGYRVYNLEKEKITVCCDVEFDEEASLNWDEQSNACRNYHLQMNNQMTVKWATMKERHRSWKLQDLNHLSMMTQNKDREGLSHL